MKKVVILKIDDYDLAVVKNKIQTALSTHFDCGKLFSSQDKILLKPNLLTISSSSEAIVTHPVIIEAVGKIFQEMGLTVFIADDPGACFDVKDVDSVYEALGLKEIARRCGFELLYPKQSIVLENLPLCSWTCPGENQEAGLFKIVNLPKLKTHDIMVLTLAVKNLYGCIRGLYKSRLHLSYPRTEEFSNVIIKLYKLIKPSLNIVDGILSLEGAGPSKRGTPRKLGVVVIGDDALYTDYVIGRFLGLKDEFNPLIKKAKQEGLIVEDDLEVISELGDFQVKDFKFPPVSVLNRLPDPAIKLLKTLFTFRPVIDPAKCRRCGVCEKICPKQAITMENNKLRINYKQCIRCMCCSEMCQFGAVDIEKSILLKIIQKIHH